MNPYKYIFCLFVLTTLCCLSSCKKETGIPGFPKDLHEKLKSEASYVDYTFSTLPFSLSHDEKPSLISNINFIDINRPVKKIPEGCKPDGRKFYQGKGELLYDIDVYLTPSCKFYVFVDKQNKPIYANYMTEAGFNFYQNIIRQVNGQIQGAQ